MNNYENASVKSNSLFSDEDDGDDYEESESKYELDEK